MMNAPVHYGSRRCQLRALGRAALIVASLLCASRVAAHAVGLSQSDFTLQPNGTVRALLVLSKLDAIRLGNMDSNRDGTISPAEVEASQRVFAALIVDGVLVRADGVACSAKLEGGGDMAGDGFGLSVLFACRAMPRVLEVEMAVLARLPSGHQHLLRIAAPHNAMQKLLSRADTSASLSVVSSPPNTTHAAPKHEQSDSPWLGALELGVGHILAGWDHWLFLAALLLGTLDLRSAIAAVSAFTVAHSITLAVSALGVYVPSPRWVEPAIAASIAFVAFENVFRPQPSGRYRISFGFGLVHGFGFASALQALALSRARLLPTLFGFNAGVELGQLALVGLALPALRVLRRRTGFEARISRRLSLAIGSVGVALFVWRIARP
jgi:hypothetical protein